jgi:hypothetical protein
MPKSLAHAKANYEVTYNAEANTLIRNFGT